MYTEIGSETHHSVNTDDNNNTCDTGDEDPLPAKRRKPRAAPAATPTICRKHTPKLRLGQHRPLVALSTTRSPKLITVICRISSVKVTDMPRGVLGVRLRQQRHYQLLSIRNGLQGFLKRTKIEDDTTYNLGLKLPLIPEHFHLPINPAALDINHNAAAHSKIH